MVCRFKHRYLKLKNCAAAACCTILLFYFASPVFSADDGTALMLEMSPPNGGYLNVTPGVYNYEMYSEISLKAVPKPGYQFVCWMGNVTNAASSSTSVFLDSPKIIIAVFERSKFDLIGLEEQLDSSIGDGGLVRSAGLGDTALEGAGGGNLPPKPNYPKNHQDPPPRPDDNGEEDPPTVPEPATMALFITGIFILNKRKKK